MLFQGPRLRTSSTLNRELSAPTRALSYEPPAEPTEAGKDGERAENTGKTYGRREDSEQSVKDCAGKHRRPVVIGVHARADFLSTWTKKTLLLVGTHHVARTARARG